MENSSPMRSAEIPKRTPDDPPPGTFRFTQDFNTNFLRTSNSRTARSELVNVSQNYGGESRRQQDPNHPPKRRRVLNREMRIEKFQKEKKVRSQHPTGILTALRVSKISADPEKLPARI